MNTVRRWHDAVPDDYRDDLRLMAIDSYNRGLVTGYPPMRGKVLGIMRWADSFYGKREWEARRWTDESPMKGQ